MGRPDLAVPRYRKSADDIPIDDVAFALAYAKACRAAGEQAEGRAALERVAGSSHPEVARVRKLLARNVVSRERRK